PLTVSSLPVSMVSNGSRLVFAIPASSASDMPRVSGGNSADPARGAWGPVHPFVTPGRRGVYTAKVAKPGDSGGQRNPRLTLCSGDEGFFGHPPGPRRAGRGGPPT